MMKSLLCLFFLAAAAHAETAAVAWTQSTEATVNGYRVYFGTLSGIYPECVQTIDAHVEIAGLTPGQTYYFVVVAFDDTGLESEYSDEVAWTAPTPLDPTVWDSMSRRPFLDPVTLTRSH